MDFTFTSWKMSSLCINVAHEAGKEEYVLEFLYMWKPTWLYEG